MRFLKIRLSFMFFLFLLPLSGAQAHDHHNEIASDSKIATASGDSIYNLASRWDRQDTRTVDLTTLKGQPIVLAMAYTSCQSSCPLIIEDMRKIQASLSKDDAGKVIFAIFSFDSKRDTPAKLVEYAKSRKLDLKTWMLFHGSATSVRKLAAILGIRYKQDSSGDFDHSNLITLLDSEGVIRYQREGLSQPLAIFEQKLKEIIQSKKE